MNLDLVLNTLLILLSGNIIWHAYRAIADIRFSGLVYHSYVLYILEMRNGLAKNYITERKNILLKYILLINYIYIYIYIFPLVSAPGAY